MYGRGLLRDGECKSGGAIATRWPEANQQNWQPFLSQSPGAWAPVWQAMGERLESSFPRPQAWVLAGKKANGPVALRRHRTDPPGSSPLGFRL